MESTTEVQTRLADRLKGLRVARGLTLDALAEQSGVSRSTISLIERGESSPTAAVLDRLAGGLGVTLASLFAADGREDASPVARREAQATWQDPATGYIRRNLSPPDYPSPIELVEVLLPAGAYVAYDTLTRAVGISQQLWVIEGAIEVTVGPATHSLCAGDCLAMRLDAPNAFRNPGSAAARYLVALTADRPTSRG
jgi:transcriptional regulator with XRE-family HTH domain